MIQPLIAGFFALAFITSNVVLAHETRARTPRTKINPLHHSGAASPYFDAPPPPGLSPDTPENCIVDQAAYLVRHGSRYPEPNSFVGWQNLYSIFQNATYIARGPLTFIPSWVPPIDNEPHEPLFLSSTGAREAFDLGVELRKKYGFTPGGENFTVWPTTRHRHSNIFHPRIPLIRNYLSTPSLNRGTIHILPDSSPSSPFADSLTPSSSCPAYLDPSNKGSTTSNAFRQSYQGRIAERLNGYLDGGLKLNSTDVGVMQDLCGFGVEVGGDRRFCDVFTESEWMDYEYAQDLNYYYGSGPGNPLSATVGYPWIKAISDLFSVGPNKTVDNGTLVPPPLIMGFSHDNNIPPLISALGLWNSSTFAPLSPTTPNPNRTFRSSHLVAFRGYLALERLTCTIGGPEASQIASQGILHVSNVLGGSVNNNNTETERSKDSEEEEVFVRVRADGAPISIPGCESGPGKTCSLEQFTEYVNGERKRVAGDFGERCGLEGVDGVVGEVRFLTMRGDGEEVVVGVN